MSILNFFGRFKRGSEASKTPEGQEIDRFIKEQEIEFRDIENFFQMLSPYQNPETLSMTLEEFIKYLEEQAKPIRENIRIETNPSKINDLNNELTNIDLLKSYIYLYKFKQIKILRFTRNKRRNNNAFAAYIYFKRKRKKN